MKSPKKQTLFQPTSVFLIIVTLGLSLTICGLNRVKAVTNSVAGKLLSLSNSAPLLRKNEQSDNHSEQSTVNRNCKRPVFSSLIPYTLKSPTIAGPPRVAVSDFNGDGFPDVALTGRSDLASVKILLGDGKGDFNETASSPFFAGRFPNQIVAADFNQDGKDDLAIANATLEGEVRILLSDGDGNFHNAVGSPIELHVNAISMGVADFNRDGKLDLVVGHADVAFASILLGDATGGFTTGAHPAVASAGEVSVRVGDFNRDGKADFAAVDLVSGMVTIQLGNGDGTFNNAPGSPFSAGDFASALVIADFDQDGKPDLAITNSTSSTVKVWIGQGNGRFQPGEERNIANQPVAIETGDFNGDRKPDIAVATENAGSSVLLGNGLGGFFGRTDWDDSDTLAVQDINLDGNPDLLFANGARLNMCSQAACDQPSFTDPRNLATGTNPYSVATDDFNRDGKPDLAITNFGSSNVTVLLGNGAGNFSEAAGSPVSAGNGVERIVTGDFNRDGKPDLAIGNFLAHPNGRVTILLGNGEGQFVPAPGAPIPVLLGAASLAVGDFNRDGKQDLAVGLIDTDHLAILLGNGDGSFMFGPPAQLNFAESSFFVAVGEFNGDGKQDLVVANGIDDETHISVLLGDGMAGFSAPTKYSVGGTGAMPNWVVVADFNRDGNADVATANFGDDTISVLLGNGAGGFSAPLRFGVQGGVALIAAADFNLDGKLDLVARYRRQGIAGNFAIFLGNSDGSFGSQLNYFQGDFPFFLGVGDFNVDGRPDLVTTNFSANTVTVLLNNCVTPKANLSLRKKASADRIVTGNTVTWTIEVINKGPNEARDVVVMDKLDPRTTFVSCNATDGSVCGGAGNTRTITFSSLPAGARATIRLIARVNCAVADDTRIKNTAMVKAVTADPVLANNSNSAAIRVVNPPPKITNVSVDKPVLWPPNNKLVDVTVNYNVTDNCYPPAAIHCQLSVKSKEPIDRSDWQVIDAHHVRLRAERLGNGNGRIYVITITCRDQSGNASVAYATVTVPKSQGK